MATAARSSPDAVIPRLARILYDTRSSATRLESLPTAFATLKRSTNGPGESSSAASASQVLAASYGVQRELSKLYATEIGGGDAIAGWKVGATTLGAQKLLGLEEPFFAPVYMPFVVDGSGGRSIPTVPAMDEIHGGFSAIGIEVEFALFLNRDLPPRTNKDNLYTREDILAAIGAIAPAFEVVSARFCKAGGAPQDLKSTIAASGPLVIADNGINDWLILGLEFSDWRQRFEGARHGATLWERDLAVKNAQHEQLAAGKASDLEVFGDPIAAVQWLANHDEFRVEGQRTLKKGDFISTGSVTGISRVKPKTHVQGDFGTLGSVHANF